MVMNTKYVQLNSLVMGNLTKTFLAIRKRAFLKRNHHEKDGKCEMHAELSLDKVIQLLAHSETKQPQQAPVQRCHVTMKQLCPLEPSGNLLV